MKATTFVQLIVQVAEFDDQGYPPSQNGMSSDTPFRPDTADLEVQKIQNPNSEGGNAASASSSSQPTTRGEALQAIESQQQPSTSRRPLVNTSNCPFLLLDLRDKDEFAECHIITAKNYPNARLARAFHFETPEMLAYKNQYGRIIIVYDNDETLSPRAAITLGERGYNNVFILSGGMRCATNLFPRGLTTGASAVALDTVRAIKPPSHPHLFPAQGAAAADDKSDFTYDDIDSLNMYLDNALKDNSSGSRLTQWPKGPTGRASTLSSLSASTNTTGTGRPPFKL